MHLGELIRDHGIEHDIAIEERRDAAVAIRQLLLEVKRDAPGPWASAAACKGQTAVMFPTRGEPTSAAHELCAGCPVFAECSAWAELVPPDQHGMIAGTSLRGRQQARSALEGAQAVEPLICAGCGEEFVPAKAASTCSNTCRSRVSRRRP